MPPPEDLREEERAFIRILAIGLGLSFVSFFLILLWLLISQWLEEPL